MPLKIVNCIANRNLITITFSEPLDQDSAQKSANYTVYAPNSVDFKDKKTLEVAARSGNFSAKLSLNFRTVNIKFIPSPPATNEFELGSSVTITVAHIIAPEGDRLHPDPVVISLEVVQEEVPRVTRAVEDAISYPILTEEIGSRPSPIGIPYGGGMTGGGTSNIGQLALKAVTDVLGWKANIGDPKGFVGALTQSFTLTEVEGHVESTWTPRTYAVQTDLGGGITGAQASLYTRAKDALDTSLRLLDGLYPLDPEADPEYVKAIREMARSQMTEIVRELGVVGLPSTLRIDTYFNILLGQNPADLANNPTTAQFDPDKIKGTLATLRDTYGIYFIENPFNNSVEDEQNITNFRVISDYMTSLMQSWIANRRFFVLGTTDPAFFGTQLVLISRQFSVLTETVNEVRFTLDSVFIGPDERQALLLEFTDGSAPMFLEGVLEEVERFAADEGPRLLRDGGKISVTNNILPVVNMLQSLVKQAHAPKNMNQLPDGFKTVRVRNSLDDLQDQLQALIELIKQIKREVPEPEGDVAKQLEEMRKNHEKLRESLPSMEDRITQKLIDHWKGQQNITGKSS